MTDSTPPASTDCSRTRGFEPVGGMLRRLCVLLVVAGMAVGMSGVPALGQEKDPTPEEKKKMDEEKQRLIKSLQEGRSKLPAEEKPLPVKGQQPPVATPPKPAAPMTIQPPKPSHTPPPATPIPAAGQSPQAPAAAGAGGEPPAELPNPGDALDAASGMFTFNFTDAVDLTLLVQYVQQALGLQMIVQDGGGLVGQKVTLMTPVTIPVQQVVPFLTMLLEQRDYTLFKNNMGIFVVSPKNQLMPVPGSDPSNTTRIIKTPGLKPTALQGPIAALIAASRGGGAGAQPVYMDDLGVIVMTDSPNVTAVVESFIAELISEQRKIGITRFPVNNIAAVSARDRVLELIGGGGGGALGGGRPGVPGQPAVAGLSGSISNLPERLTLDPSSNAILFRGRPDEVQLLQSLLPLVDVPNALEARWYPIGMRAAETVTDWAKRLQLGEVTFFESSDSAGFSGAQTRGTARLTGAAPGLAPGGFQQDSGGAGAGFVIYPEAGGFMYRGTPQQHAKVNDLIQALGPLSEFNDEVVYEFYKLRHSKAEDVANVINDLINNQQSDGNRGGLLGRDLGTGNRSPSATDRTRQLQRQLAGDREPQAAASAGGEGGGGIAEITSEDVFVLADEQNNQVVVKAPKRLQDQVRGVIDRLDLRRPQVYIEAKVVSITTGDDFRLAVEVQQIIGQFALTTNFGLSSIGDAGNILTRKTVTTGQGLTAALVRSKDVPFIIDAISRDTDARVVASPQLLVDDNQEAEIESKDAQPTTTTSIGSAGQQNTQSFGGFEEAGPRLRVKPQISEGGYMRLEYEVELSSFTGESQDGVPPPKQTNRLTSESVTVPSDTTIVVGGLAQEFQSENVIGVPLLKDIPVIGVLFKDTRIQKRNVTLYVFITPKIMRDPSFADLRLITRKPLGDARLESELPPPTHERIDLTDSARVRREDLLEETITEQREKYEPRPLDKPHKRPSQGWVE